MLREFTADDRLTFQKFLEKVNVIPLDSQNAALLDLIVRIRMQHRLKLPDAIIAATAIFHQADLISGDKSFAAITELKTIAF